MNQLTLDHAIAKNAGRDAAMRSLDRAQRADSTFVVRAKEAILKRLQDGPCSGEVLTELCKAQGIRPVKDDRAFGGVFLSLSSEKNPQIRCIRSDLPRARGHGTSGGKLWAIVKHAD